MAHGLTDLKTRRDGGVAHLTLSRPRSGTTPCRNRCSNVWARRWI